MKRKTIRRSVVALLLGIITTAVFAQPAVSYWEHLPQPTGYVNDFENILTAKERAKLTRLITNYEKRTTNEIVVVTLPTTATDKNLFDSLTLYLAQRWRVGKATKSNGVLIGISAGYRIIRIQNGDGIVKVFSNEETKQIIDQIMAPQFKSGNYYKGIYDAVQAYKKGLKGKI
ncbi:MAG: TPM domain-containing protein [Chitinophagales bacterium]